MKKTEGEVKTRETAYYKMFIKDGILHYYYKEIENMNLELAKTCVHDRLEFTEHKSYPCLVDFILLKNSTKEARDYFANEGNEGLKATALLVKSTAFKMMANFYIMVNKPLNPTRMFTDKNAALEWLEQFK